MRILVLGGAGFVGSNFVHYTLAQHPDYEVYVVDKLTYAGNLTNLESVLGSNRLRFFHLDICDPTVYEAVRGCDLAVNFAVESHVSRKFNNGKAFVRNNIEGTWRLLETCRRLGVSRFLQVSTDEVYGTLGPTGSFREDMPLSPCSPYAASKAAADQMVLAYFATYGFPALVTRCSNNYGPYQFPEQFIPQLILQAQRGEFLTIDADANTVRDWIHVSDHCRALDLVLQSGTEGSVYNIGADFEISNIDIARRVLAIMNRPLNLIQRTEDERLAETRRVSMDCSKLKRDVNWAPAKSFDQSLADTIQWYQENSAWLDQVRSGEYLEYFDRNQNGLEALLRQLNYGFARSN